MTTATPTRPLDTLDTWAAWEGWRDAVIAHYGAQPHWGCPIGTLAGELTGKDPECAVEVNAHMDQWRGYLEAGCPSSRPCLSSAVFAELGVRRRGPSGERAVRAPDMTKPGTRGGRCRASPDWREPGQT